VTVPKTETATTIGPAYRFVPVTLNTEQADSVFALNVGEAYTTEDGRRYPEGSVFVRGLRAVQPFEGYITAADAGAKVRYIPIGQDAATGMDDVRWSMYDERCTMDDVPGGEAYYDLSGRRIGKPTKAGVYLMKKDKTVQKVWMK